MTLLITFDLVDHKVIYKIISYDSFVSDKHFFKQRIYFMFSEYKNFTPEGLILEKTMGI